MNAKENVAAFPRLKPGERLGSIHWHINDEDTGEWFFAVGPGVEDFEKAARAAVKDHLREHPHTESRAFNWGDAIEHVSEACWARHGLRLLGVSPELSFSVVQGEPLNDEFDTLDVDDEDRLAALAEARGLTPEVLLERLDIHHDRYHGGGFAEVVRIALGDDEDFEWLESVIKDEV